MRRQRSTRGFTLVEALIVLAVVAVITGLGMPALQQMIHRSKIEGIARQTSVMMQAARLEAIKRSRPGLVKIDTATRQIVSFIDENDDAVQDPAEGELGLLTLPSGVNFSAPPAQQAIDGFESAGTEGWVTFEGDGSVELEGAFRFGDPRGNFLEVRVAPAATARAEVRKWDGSDWQAPGEGGQAWQWQ